MKSYKGLTGNELEEWFKYLIQEMFLFDNYFGSTGQIPLNRLDPAQGAGEHLEIDGVLLINKTCILLEFTSQSSRYKDKINKFIRNAHIFTTSNHLSLREKFELFGISNDKLDDFEEIESWKYVFFGTNEAFETSKTTREDFPEFNHIQQQLFIFRPSELDYISQLVIILNKYARNEFLAAINFSPEELGDNQIERVEYIKLQGKYITSDKKVKADIFLVKMKVATLLKIARVSRHESIPFILDGDEKTNYQRLLIPKKLKSISENFISNNRNMAFPNTITLVLSNDCEDNNGRLNIPLRFSSIDIIDGQHRLFAYTNPNISDTIRDEAEILASVIKFRAATPKKIARYSAKVFCDINSNQAKVKNNLIYLIKYDVLGDKDYEAIAGKILLECDNAYNKTLSKILLTNSLRKKNKLGLPSIPITTIVDNDLIPFLKGVKTDKTEINDADFIRIFGENREYYKNHYGEFWKKGKELIEQYFNFIKATFPHDWTVDCKSYLQSSIYYSAFIRFLRYKLFDEGKEMNDLQTELTDLRTAVDIIVTPNNSPSFPREGNLVPSVKKGIRNVFAFLTNPSPQ